MNKKLPGAGTTIKYKKGGQTRKAMRREAVPKPEVLTVEEPMGLIYGQSPQSSYEWNMARALWAYGWEFYYQVQVLGGWGLRGGQSLDFLVKTRPLLTAVPVDGGYWHRSPLEEKLKDQFLLDALRDNGYEVRSEVFHAVDKDAETLEAAKQFVYTHFGRT